MNCRPPTTPLLIFKLLIMSFEITPNPRFHSSVFPLRTRPSEEVNNLGNVIKLHRGMSVPDFIRSLYNPHKLSTFAGDFNFLDRDNKTREYDPKQEDPMVFNSLNSIHKFKDVAIQHIKFLTQEWKKLGLPTKIDADRGVELPDTETFVGKILSKDAAALDMFKRHKDTISYIGSNVDIMKKAAIVRTVLPGWWIVSYRGSNAPDAGHFAPAIRIIQEALRQIRNSKQFRNVLTDVVNNQGNPLYTNVGYPYFSASVDANGRPIARDTMVELFKNIGHQGHSVPKILSSISRRVTDSTLKLYPWAISCIRRSQPGYKWHHVWQPSSQGLHLSHDRRGDNTTRVAWNAAAHQNDYISAIQSELKAFRKLIPGMFFDGDSKKRVLDDVRSENGYLFESDYSNYDRTIANNISSMLFAVYAKLTKYPQYVYDLLKRTNTNIPIIWPDWIPGERGRGWIFEVDQTGLLSGLKITADLGSMVNLVVVSQSILDAEIMDEGSLLRYLTAKISGKYHSEFRHLFLIQSDDTMFKHKDIDVLIKLVNAFIANGKRAGMKGTLEIGDRFLMRHMSKGMDRPLLSRIFQNTLSNESGYDDAVKFAVGLAARTDGILGHKTIDPFGTGKHTSISELDRAYTILVLKDIDNFLRTAHTPNRLAYDFIKLLIEGAETMTKHGDGFILTSRSAHAIDESRLHLIKLLATREQQKSRKELLRYLHYNEMSPTAKYTLDFLTGIDAEARRDLSSMASQEHSYYVQAMKSYGIPLYVDE